MIEMLVVVNPPSPAICQRSRIADNYNVTHAIDRIIPMCLWGGYDSFPSLPRTTRRLGAFVVLCDDLFDERITKGSHQIGHHLRFGALPQKRHMRHCRFYREE